MLFAQADGFFVLAFVVIGDALSRAQVVLECWAIQVTKTFIHGSALGLACRIERTVHTIAWIKFWKENKPRGGIQVY